MKYVLILFLFIPALQLRSQEVKSLVPKAKSDSNITFTGTKIIERDDDYDSTGHFILSGYVSVYYAGYSDTSGKDGFQKFPTVAPRKDNFGLNMAMLSLQYRSDHFRANSTLHFGDIPLSAWSPNFNNIQEANLGFRLIKNVWLDAGFFRTHIGLESIQPRENIAMSISVVTYYEPYFLSGAKLSYTGLEKFIFQLNVFNSFNGFIETNKSKAYGASMVYEASKKISFTVNSITCDEVGIGDGSHQRWYNNLYGTFRSTNWNAGFDLNYALQKNSGLTDSNKTTVMFSLLAAVKYRFYRTFSVYGRMAFYQDRDEMLTGPIKNENHQQVGLDLLGSTLGIEFRFIPNSYLRFEGRLLETNEKESIFYPYQGNNNRRLEFISALGVWF